MLPGKEIQIKCPVCNEVMRNADNDNKLFLCPIRRKVYPKDFSVPIPYYDCALGMDEEGNIVYQHYELPPYKVVITAASGTKVSRVVQIQYSEHFGMEDDEPGIVWTDVFQTDAQLELPIQDLDKCVQKLHLLTTFS